MNEYKKLDSNWIDEHVVYADVRGGTQAFIHVDDLESLLVPKQELPVIPNCVAKWISIHHEQFDLYPALKRLENNALSWEDVYYWYRKNTHKFVDAYLTGEYEVEEEQKYVVMIPHQLNNAFDLYLCETDAAVYFLDKEDEFNSRVKYKFTEEEIKEINPDYMTFAKPVEELEE